MKASGEVLEPYIEVVIKALLSKGSGHLPEGSITLHGHSENYGLNLLFWGRLLRKSWGCNLDSPGGIRPILSDFRLGHSTKMTLFVKPDRKCDPPSAV